MLVFVFSLKNGGESCQVLSYPYKKIILKLQSPYMLLPSSLYEFKGFSQRWKSLPVARQMKYLGCKVSISGRLTIQHNTVLQNYVSGQRPCRITQELCYWEQHSEEEPKAVNTYILLEKQTQIRIYPWLATEWVWELNCCWVLHICKLKIHENHQRSQGVVRICLQIFAPNSDKNI